MGSTTFKKKTSTLFLTSRDGTKKVSAILQGLMPAVAFLHVERINESDVGRVLFLLSFFSVVQLSIFQIAWGEGGRSNQITNAKRVFLDLLRGKGHFMKISIPESLLNGEGEGWRERERRKENEVSVGFCEGVEIRGHASRVGTALSSVCAL